MRGGMHEDRRNMSNSTILRSFNKRTNQPTDQPTHGRADKTSFRCARSHMITTVEPRNNGESDEKSDESFTVIGGFPLKMF